MRKDVFFCGRMPFLFLSISFLFVVNGCTGSLGGDSGEGILRISFDSEYRVMTRAGLSIPDTSDFLLTVREPSGAVVYEGKYGDSPEAIKVHSGSCTVSVISEAFDTPAFDAPQFGDEQCVVVPSDGVVSVRLLCSQLNCGVRLKVDSGFLSAYPSSVLFLRSSQGRLMYAYSERRTAYFSPGSISLVMVTGEEEQTLMTRTLLEREMLTLGVSVASSGGTQGQAGTGISIAVDTSRVWSDATCVIGGGNSGDGGGSEPEDALTISQAKDSVGAEDVWVCAYIVGGDLTSASASFDPPFSSRTNLLIGPRSVIADRSSGMSVQLPSGKIRDALNLVDNPHLLGCRIMLKGDIVEAYYGLTGIKNVSDYEIK